MYGLKSHKFQSSGPVSWRITIGDRGAPGTGVGTSGVLLRIAAPPP